MMDCIERQFEAVGDAELVKNVVEVILYGLLADQKSYTAFLVVEALDDELDDFLLAVADERLSASGFGCGEGLDHFGGPAVIEPDFTRTHATYAL
jgi:hypothetical protein